MIDNLAAALAAQKTVGAQLREALDSDRNQTSFDWVVVPLSVAMAAIAMLENPLIVVKAETFK